MNDRDDPTVTGLAGRTTAPATSGNALELESGDTVGRYTIHAQRGEGGMGVVYEAYDSELDRRIALKVVHPREGSSSSQGPARARLAREAQAMAKLSHPNVIPVFDVGSIGDEVFIAMELVDGVDLKKWLRIRERSWREIVDAFIQAGKGLGAAHAAGLIHRDFKPANALVGNDGRVRVVDFGLARAATPGRRSGKLDVPEVEPDRTPPTPLSSPLTRAGEILGTPAYMAPEQHVGKEADPRTDQFSFCVSLWEALYGERPFVADTLEELALEVTQGKLREPPKTSKIPRGVRRILERGLSIDAADRYPSMSALLSDLRSVRSGSRRLQLAAIAGVVAIAAGGAVYWQMNRDSATCASASDHLAGVWDDARKAEIRAAFTRVDKPYVDATWTGVERVLDRYTGEWVDTHTDACKATRVRDEQSTDLLDLRMACLDERLQQLAATTDIFAHADADIVQSALTAVYQLPGLDPCSDLTSLTAGVALPEGDALRVEVAGIRAQIAAARATAETGDSVAAQSMLTELAADVADVDYPPVRAEVLYALGYMQDTNGDAEAAQDTLKRAILAAESAGHDTVTVDAQIDLAWVMGYSKAQYEPGIDLLDRAEAILERIGDDDTAAERALNTRGAIFQEQGKLPEALALYEEVKAKRERALGPDHPQVAAILINIGNLYLRQGKYADAQAQYESALAIYRAVFGDDHPDLFGAHYSMGHAHLYQAHYDEALASYSRALALREAALGPDNPQLAGVLNNMGVVYQYSDRLEQAYEMYARSLELKRKQNPDHPSVANSEANLGGLLTSLGRYEEALAHHERALAIRTAKHSEPHADVANSLDRTGIVYAAMGKYDEAMDYHKRAREIYVAALGADHPEVAVVLANIGHVHAARGDHAKALAAFRESASIRVARLGEDHPKTHRSRADMARALIELGRAGEAVEVLEPTLERLLATDADQAVLVDTQFSLARALWLSGGDRDRARSLATSARDGAASLGSSGASDLAAIEGWLASPR